MASYPYHSHLLAVGDVLLHMDSLEAFENTFWERHANPKSGWSRVLVLPALLYAVYRRSWHVAAVALAFTAINPFLFAPPADDDAWMTRVVRAERWWTADREQHVLGRSYPNSLNLLTVPVTGYAFVAAYRRRPLRTVLAGLAVMLLKFWYVGALVRRYDAEKAASP